MFRDMDSVLLGNNVAVSLKASKALEETSSSDENANPGRQQYPSTRFGNGRTGGLCGDVERRRYDVGTIGGRRAEKASGSRAL